MRLRSTCSTLWSASVTGVRSGLVATTRSAARKRSMVMPSARSASSSASARSLRLASWMRLSVFAVSMGVSLPRPGDAAPGTRSPAGEQPDAEEGHDDAGALGPGEPLRQDQPGEHHGHDGVFFFNDTATTE